MPDGGYQNKMGHKETKMYLKLICSYNIQDAKQSSFVLFYPTSAIAIFFLIKLVIYPLTHLQWSCMNLFVININDSSFSFFHIKQYLHFIFLLLSN